jgi:hypothetical protein
MHRLIELPMALLSGKLIERGRCLFGQSRDPRDPGQHLLIWPSGSRVEQVDGILTVRMAEGVLPVGGIFSAGGGEYSDQAFVERLIGGPIPVECNTAVYWLIGELVSATTG